VTVNDVKVFDQDEQLKKKEVELSDLFEKLGSRLGTGQWLGKPVMGGLLFQASDRVIGLQPLSQRMIGEIIPAIYDVRGKPVSTRQDLK
jgi:hypothetical protein